MVPKHPVWELMFLWRPEETHLFWLLTAAGQTNSSWQQNGGVPQISGIPIH